MNTKFPKQDLVFIIVSFFFVVFYFGFQPQINDFLNTSFAKNSQEYSYRTWNSYADMFRQFPSFGFSFSSDDNKAEVLNTVEPTISIVKDCGTVGSIDSSNYGNNPVLACLGYSALKCTPAKAVVTDTIFPTIFEVVKNGNTCDFKLSYASDSTLVDVTGKKLSEQYVSCPLSIVKAFDTNSKNIVEFSAPEQVDFSKYASQIYVYGTLGLFIENNLDLNKIHSAGCTGNYIDSVIASYNLSQSK